MDSGPMTLEKFAALINELAADTEHDAEYKKIEADKAVVELLLQNGYRIAGRAFARL